MSFLGTSSGRTLLKTMHITGTYFNYYQVCKRKLWLFAHQIEMESSSDLVSEGKLLHLYTYPQRSEKHKEVAIDDIKLDYFDRKWNVVHEIKKSDKIEEAHILQLQFYLYTLEKIGMKKVSGLLEYPLLKKTLPVGLNNNDRQRMVEIINDINMIAASTNCPSVLRKPICNHCSYHDFCYISEDP